jgi:hypothetical protein
MTKRGYCPAVKDLECPLLQKFKEFFNDILNVLVTNEMVVAGVSEADGETPPRVRLAYRSKGGTKENRGIVVFAQEPYDYVMKQMETIQASLEDTNG